MFQLFSHKSLYDDKGEIKPATVAYAPRTGPSAKERTKKFFRLSTVQEAKEEGASAEGSIDSGTNFFSPHLNYDLRRITTGESRRSAANFYDGDEEIPQLSLSMAIALLVVVTVLVAVTAKLLVGSIDGLANSGGVSREFIGLILIPTVGNAAVYITAVAVSVRDKLSLSVGVAVGISIVSPPPQACYFSFVTRSILNLLLSIQQIALFVIPFIVVLGWIIGRPMTMLFDPFESIVLFFSVLTVNYAVQDGRSNWLGGTILICLYVSSFHLTVVSPFLLSFLG